MNARAALVALIRGVREDIGRCDGIEALLAEQRQALIRHDVDGLAALNATLRGELARMGTSARARSEQLRTLGQSGDTQGMTRLLERLAPALAAELRPLWQRLEQALARCRALNERNGMLLAGQKELLAQTLGGDNPGYAPAG